MAEAMLNDKLMQATIPALPMQCNIEVYEADTGGEVASHQRRSSRSVGFDIPAPAAKRQRPSTEVTAQNVTLAIQHGVSIHDRKDALYNACAAFDHGVQAAHDDEIKVGADTAIFKHLTYLLYKRAMLPTASKDQDHATKKEDENPNTEQRNDEDDREEKEIGDFDSITEEISNTVKALEMVLRCSPECISVSYQRIGQEALPILLTLLNEQREQKLHQLKSSFQQKLSVKREASNVSDETSPSTPDINIEDNGDTITNRHLLPRKTCDSILCIGSKILGHFARVGDLTTKLASTPNLLSTLKDMADLPLHSLIPIEARFNSLWIIANLACSSQNMIKMAKEPGLVDTLVTVASHPTEKEEEEAENVIEFLKVVRSRSIAIRAILNLSWAHENKVALIEHPNLVEILLKSASHRESEWSGNGKGVSTILLQSRRHAAGALRNLAAAPRRYKRRLCRNMRDGRFLEVLSLIAKSDPDAVVRDKIHATLFNLVSADTAKLFVETKSVLDVITEASNANEDLVSKHSSDCASSRTMALQTLRSLEKAIPEDEADYDLLRPALSRFDSEVGLAKSKSLIMGPGVEQSFQNV
ncbi:hypothetical protein CTEN210_03376 [Chaetoceros tenuissimus]|uniref:Uncharacterized protein n=1 Tax=Chaetoceros tenuissimus TaxID=426638 RepID=A0AAD3CIT2_9STRA|nr:hypothetical protein CTEN210_03376 [Chaetoceros tenuissimus]